MMFDNFPAAHVAEATRQSQREEAQAQLDYLNGIPIPSYGRHRIE